MRLKFFTFLVCSVLITVYAQAQQITPPPVSPNVWPDAPWDKIADQLKKELSLDKSQKTQVKDAYKEYYNEVSRYLNSETGDEQPKNPKSKDVDDDAPMNNLAIVKLINRRNLQIKKVLTAEQYQKYLSLAKNYDQSPFAAAHGPVYQ